MHSAAAFFGVFALGAVHAQRPIRSYSCNNNFNICQNICYWQICVHPEQTFYTPSRANGDPEQRRIDCGATHDPETCPPSGLGIGDTTNTSPDEFPFASLEQGGRTPFGDGASVLCVPLAEQRSQGGKVRQLYNGLNDGDEFELALQDTGGIPWCDPSATPTAGSCDGTEFNGVHFFPDDNIFCQWDIDASTTARCIDGETGDDVDPPAKKRSAVLGEPRMANYTALLHIREPEMVDKLPNEERERSKRQMAGRYARGLQS
ncbi:hypothetical protein HJFPF1_06021 [Paramyrothecium foliicola]|nr:hypothetical protein HJFPF1_06021 [Paramyrothecium foliicola]